MTKINQLRLSKFLSLVLRHKAKEFGLNISSQGLVGVTELLEVLKKQKGLESVTIVDIHHVVIHCSKQRFNLTCIDNNLFISANQGHSIESVTAKRKEVTDSSEIPICIHGTNMNAIQQIHKSGGLSRMDRNDIHMASALPETECVISGMRKSASVVIWIDVERAMAEGIKFFISNNGVILSPGNEHGFIPSSCFMKISYR
jgi:2'-phosphotransferase